MKKLLLFFLLLIIISFFVNGQTNVSGGIYSDTTWTKANSPYIVVDNVVVFPGVTLTIQPGVVVKFADNKGLEINGGTLIAEGTVTDSIIFTSNSATPDSGIWNDIYLNVSVRIVEAHFNYCNINYATNGISCSNLSYLITLTIKNSLFYNNITGLNNGWATQIDSCNFIKNTNGLLNLMHGSINYCNISSNLLGLMNCYDVSETHCHVFSNQIGFKYCERLNLKNCMVDSNQIGLSSLFRNQIDSCFISKNQIGMLDTLSQGGNSLISNSSIDSNAVAGIYFGNVYHSSTSVINCQIKGNGIGIIDNVSTSWNIFTKNIIESNAIGVQLGTSIDSFYCNKICNNSSYDLKYLGTMNVNLSNNFWCTSDSISTQAVIFDGNDSAALGFVNFIPFDTVQCYLCRYIFVFSYYPIFLKEPSCATCSDGIATASPTNGTPPYSYSWNTNPVQTTQTATGLANGLYNVCITDSTGCSECASVGLWWAVQVNEIISNLSLSVFPNPTSDKITISGYHLSGKEARFEIYNMIGENVYSKSEIKNQQSEIIDISSLTSGIYIIQVMDGEKIFRGKIVKQ